MLIHFVQFAIERTSHQNPIYGIIISMHALYPLVGGGGGIRLSGGQQLISTPLAMVTLVVTALLLMKA